MKIFVPTKHLQQMGDGWGGVIAGSEALSNDNDDYSDGDGGGDG